MSLFHSFLMWDGIVMNCLSDKLRLFYGGSYNKLPLFLYPKEIIDNMMNDSVNHFPISILI